MKLLSTISPKIKFSQKSIRTILYYFPKINKIYKNISKLLKIRLISIQNNSHKYDVFHPMIGKIICNIYFSEKFENKIKKIIEKIATRSFLVLQLTQTVIKTYNPLHITIYYDETKKTCTYGEDKFMSPVNVNSGFTHVINNDTIAGPITIYRKEELLKVCIHEVLHSTYIDTKNIFSGPSLCSSSNIMYSEAYVEFFASFLNIICTFIEKKIKKERHMELIEREYKWNMYQSAKILSINNFELFESIFDKKCKQRVMEKTNSISYYCIKAALFHNCQYVLSIFFKKKNNKIILKSNINTTEITTNSLFNKTFIRRQNNIIKWISKNKKKRIHKSMRMTLLE